MGAKPPRVGCTVRGEAFGVKSYEKIHIDPIIITTRDTIIMLDCGETLFSLRNITVVIDDSIVIFIRLKDLLNR